MRLRRQLLIGGLAALLVLGVAGAWFYQTPEFYDDIYLRPSNTQMPRTRLIYPVEGPNGTIYWVLTRGR